MTIYLNLPILAVINTPLMILYGVLGVAVIALLVLLLYFMSLRKKIKNVSKTKIIAKWFEAVGGKNNVVTIQGVGSRLNFVLIDQTQICRGDLEQLGAKSVLSMANKVTVVMENQAEKIAAILNQGL